MKPDGPRALWASSAPKVTPSTDKGKKLRQQAIFDSLWGIPGGWHRLDLAILRSIRQRREALEGLVDPTPFVVLDEEDIAANRDLCCNHAFGRAAREYAWHNSWHALKYTVYNSTATVERVIWGIVSVCLLVLAVVFAASLIDAYICDPVFIAVDKVGLDPGESSRPPVTICPRGPGILNASEKKRAEVESLLPPMRLMWDMWEAITTEEFDPDKKTSNLPWANTTSDAVKSLMLQVMIEGGLMSMPSCSETLTECNLGKVELCCKYAELVLTREGPCHKLDLDQVKSGAKSVTQRRDLGHYVKAARNDLNLEVELTGTTSGRVGFPIVTADYFGTGFICADTWGQAEAEVLCKSLGFTGGERYALSRTMTFRPTNILGFDLTCAGDENSILECQSTYKGMDGDTLGQCRDHSEPMGIICDQISIQMGNNHETTTGGVPYLTVGEDSSPYYFCADEVDREEAQVLCQMLSWPLGKGVTLPGGNLNSLGQDEPATELRIKDLNCDTDKEPHILDCDYTLAEAASDTCQEVAAIECSPGFPLTVRPHNHPLEGRTPEDEKTLVWAYPAIDTPGHTGFICDRDGDSVDQEAVEALCRKLGFPIGLKLPGGIFGKPSFGDAETLYVLDRIQCAGIPGGAGQSVFDCGLGPWGDHECPEGQILSLACAFDGDDLRFDHVLFDVHPESGEYAVLQDSATGMVGIEVTLGLIVPSCSGEKFGDPEADQMCHQRGFACGILDRAEREGEELLLVSKQLLTGVFVEFECSPLPKSDVRPMGSCRHVLTVNCESKKPARVRCVAEQDPEFELCKLLRQPTTEQTVSGFLSDTLELAVASNQDIGAPESIQQCREHDNDFAHLQVHIGGAGRQSSDMVTKTLSYGSLLEARVSQSIVDSTQAVKDRWTMAKRGCTVSGYDENTDEEEPCDRKCQTELAVQVCSCLPWYLSRNGADKPICSGPRVLCLKRLKSALEIVARNVSLGEALVHTQELRLPDRGALQRACECPRPCDHDVTYKVEATKTVCAELQQARSARIRVTTDTGGSVKYSRRETMSWQVVLGLVGGIFALLAGFGVVSVLEIFYFFIVRWFEACKDPAVNGRDRVRPLAADLEGVRRASDSDLLLRHTFSQHDEGAQLGKKESPGEGVAAGLANGEAQRTEMESKQDSKDQMKTKQISHESFAKSRPSSNIRVSYSSSSSRRTTPSAALSTRSTARPRPGSNKGNDDDLGMTRISIDSS